MYGRVGIGAERGHEQQLRLDGEGHFRDADPPCRTKWVDGVDQGSCRNAGAVRIRHYQGHEETR